MIIPRAFHTQRISALQIIVPKRGFCRLHPERALRACSIYRLSYRSSAQWARKNNGTCVARVGRKAGEHDSSRWTSSWRLLLKIAPNNSFGDCNALFHAVNFGTWSHPSRSNRKSRRRTSLPRSARLSPFQNRSCFDAKLITRSRANLKRTASTADKLLRFAFAFFLAGVVLTFAAMWFVPTLKHLERDFTDKPMVVGRYQMYTGTLPTSANGTAGEPVTMIMDTSYGQVWRLTLDRDQLPTWEPFGGPTLLK